MRPPAWPGPPDRPAPRARRDRRRLLRAAAGLLLPGAAAQATDSPSPAAADSAPPPEVAEAWAAAALQGRMRYRWFGLTVYDARLWTPAPLPADAYAERPFALELRYARALQGAAIAERSLQEMRRLAELPAARAEGWLAAMRAAFPDVLPGDRLTGVHLPARGARFFHNARLTRQIDDAAFAELFFGIWLSPRSAEPALRRALLGAQG